MSNPISRAQRFLLRYARPVACAAIFLGSVLLQNAIQVAGAGLVVLGGALIASRGALIVSNTKALQYAQEFEAQSAMGRLGFKVEDRSVGAFMIAVGLGVAVLGLWRLIRAFV